MKVNLFDIDGKTGKAKITKHVKDIWYLNILVEQYGEQNALKLFKIFDMMYNLNPSENPYANTVEANRFETILRSTYPELEIQIDMDSEIIEQALDLVEELYETPKYRQHKALKNLQDKITTQLKYAQVSLNREDGNMGEINKALDKLNDLNKQVDASYKELEEEMQIAQVRGGGSRRRKSEDLL